MSCRGCILAVIVMLLVSIGERADGRLVALVTEQEMVDRSDLIVMAKVVEVRDTGVATTIPNIRRGNEAIAAVEMEATFAISAVVKGKHEGAKIVLVYLREAKHE